VTVCTGEGTYNSVVLSTKTKGTWQIYYQNARNCKTS